MKCGWKHVLGSDSLFKALRGCLEDTFSDTEPFCWYHRWLFYQHFLKFYLLLRIIFPNCSFCNILISSDICKLSSIHQLKVIPRWACTHFVKFQCYPLTQISSTLLFFKTWCLFTSSEKIFWSSWLLLCLYLSLAKIQGSKDKEIPKANLMFICFQK